MIECSTGVKTEMLGIKWMINRFRVLAERVERSVPLTLNSAPVAVNTNGDELALRMCISELHKDSIRNITIELYGMSKICHSRIPFEVLITCDITKPVKSRLHCCMHKFNFHNGIKVWADTYESLITQAHVKDFNDNLTIECRIERIDGVVTVTSDSGIPKSNSYSLPRCFAEYFEKEKFTDITFVFGDKKLRAHKVICAGSSSVFVTMFEQQMKERNKNEVKIDDIDYDVFKKMLQFIYTNRIYDFEKLASNLLYAADKFHLQELKEQCAETIWKNLTASNVLEALVFANLHNVKQLMESVQSFIRVRISDVAKTEVFKNMEKEQPELALKVLRMSHGRKLGE